MSLRETEIITFPVGKFPPIGNNDHWEQIFFKLVSTKLRFQSPLKEV